MSMYSLQSYQLIKFDFLLLLLLLSFILFESFQTKMGNFYELFQMINGLQVKNVFIYAKLLK